MTITLIGNVGKDAELRHVTLGDTQVAVCSFWVAENIKKRDDSTKTVWRKVTIWRKYAETMAQYLKSGRKVYVTGTSEASYYVKENVVHPYDNIQATEIRLLDGKKPEEEAPEATEEVEDAGTPWD